MSRADSVAVKQRANSPLFVAPLQDREVVSMCDSLTNWAVLGNDTTNFALDNDHVLSTKSFSFDKVDGAANTVYAGMETQADYPAMDLSRFIATDRFEVLFKIPDLTDVAAAHLFLGTDSSNYAYWSIDDSVMDAIIWNLWSPYVYEMVGQMGTGIDWEEVPYVAFMVQFDAETDALANMNLDSIILRSNY